MSIADPGGGPAFPGKGPSPLAWINEATGESGVVYGNQFASGMALRDYFAAKAMQGFLTSCITPGPGVDGATLARSSYQMADHMLAARAAK